MKKFGRVAKVIMGTTGWFARGGDNNDRKICLSYNDIIICPVLIEAGLGNLDCPDESCTDDGTSVARPIPSVSEGLSHDRSFNHFSFRRACLLAESGLHVPGLSCVTYLHQQGPCKRPAGRTCHSGGRFPSMKRVASSTVLRTEGRPDART
jgi:hypothetical protein